MKLSIEHNNIILDDEGDSYDGIILYLDLYNAEKLVRELPRLIEIIKKSKIEDKKKEIEKLQEELRKLEQ